MDRKAAEKKERLLQALDQGMVMIHLDARRPGVLVPVHLRGEAHLRLNLSYRFDPPDLSVGDWGVRSTLSFSGSRFTVAVPWSALYAITSRPTKEFWIYPDDMPEELVQQTTVAPPAEDRGPPGKDGDARPSPRTLLREVACPPEVQGEGSPGDGTARPSPEGPEEDPPRPRGRAHLRVVK